jgi:hypothetical protein
MNFIGVLCVLVGLAMAAALIFLYRRLFAGPKTLPVSVDWISELSVIRYRPMERLLAGEDYRFLASQPGYTPKMLRHLRARRRRLFRGYMAALSRDFTLVGAALRLIITYSPQDRPELSRILYQQQLLFAAGMLRVHCALLFDRFGLGTVDVRGLVRAMEYMRLELRQMIPADQPVAA